jgi:uncharacterized protein (TIGR03437 family)
MRFFVSTCGLILIGCLAASAQPAFSNGQAARAVIGQRHFTAQEVASDTTASNALLGGAGSVALAGNVLIVADANRVAATPNNNRVLIFRNIDRMLPAKDAELPISTARCQVCVQGATNVLGQSNFTEQSLALSSTGMRQPTAVATDGTVLAVADTDNNRVLIWNNLPTANGQAADVVIGQQNFTTTRNPRVVDASSLRGPQGVWIQNGRLYIADTGNDRVLLYNSIPRANNAAADLVLGQANLTTGPRIDVERPRDVATASNMFAPVSVTSDGVRLFVADLGQHRVMVWNRIPTANNAAADFMVGQPELNTSEVNNASRLCTSNGTDSAGAATFPVRCLATLDSPRFALSDGTRLFVSDGGNDRVLIWNAVPTRNGQPADVVLGQFNGELNNTSDGAFSEFVTRVSAADVMRAPAGLAWNGRDLYVADPFNRRVLVFSPAEKKVADTGVRNAASPEVRAVGRVSLSGDIRENDVVTITISTNDTDSREYKHTVVRNDSLPVIIQSLARSINGAREGRGDASLIAVPVVLESVNGNVYDLLLSAREAGEPGNAVRYNASTNEGAGVRTAAPLGNLAGGQNSGLVAAGMIVNIIGDNLADAAASAPANATALPRELGGVQVYFDGIRAPLFAVSPGQITAQVPWEVADSVSINTIVRTMRRDGSISVSSPVAAPIIRQNPGIFADEGQDPRPGIVMHYSSAATATVSIDGSAAVNNVATVIINGREYSYTVLANDTTVNIRDGLINAINAGGGDPELFAFPSGWYTRIRLRAKVNGDAGNGIPVATRVSDGAQVIVTALNAQTCCANTAGARVTTDNPALPGSTVVIMATGLGSIRESNNPAGIIEVPVTGEAYRGPELNEPAEFVASLAGGRTAQVLYAGLKPGMIGIYEVHLELNSDLPTDPVTQLTISQSFQTSNIITFPVRNPRSNDPIITP